jgi:hypothetical protein
LATLRQLGYRRYYVSETGREFAFLRGGSPTAPRNGRYF